MEEFHEGVVDVVHRKALTFGGAKGLEVVQGPVPADLAQEVEAKRAELVEKVSEVGSSTKCCRNALPSLFVFGVSTLSGSM